jgi:glycosyltransferase involved in cell wall biosynthesis
MKLIFFCNGRLPTEKAYGYHACKMCEKFAEAGFAVELWYPVRQNKINENIFAYYGLKQNFSLKPIKHYDFFRVYKYLGKLAYYLNNLLFFLSVGFCRFDKDTIVYTLSPGLIWWFNWRGFKTGYESHDWFGSFRKLCLHTFYLKVAKRIITTNQYIKNKFVERGFTEENILVAPNGIDIEEYDFDCTKQEAIDRLGLDSGLNDKKIFLYTGSLKTKGVEKGIDEIFAAMKILADKNLFFMMVGASDDDKLYYDKLASQLGIASQVGFEPRVKHDKLALYQKAADLLLMPFPDRAHYRYFMSPMKMFEYMASGRPIIASNLPSIKEILNENNCVFCAPDNAPDLAEKIKLVLNNSDLAKRVSTQALLDAKQYTWRKRAEKIKEFLVK